MDRAESAYLRGLEDGIRRASPAPRRSIDELVPIFVAKVNAAGVGGLSVSDVHDLTATQVRAAREVALERGLIRAVGATRGRSVRYVAK